MARTSKQDWLDAGLHILAEHGAAMLTIDRLTLSLGVTKGSFYHHFQGLGGYKQALLEYTEQLAWQRIQQPTPPPTPFEGMDSLFSAAEPCEADWETPLRVWAMQDEDVRAVQERIDARRNTLFQALCRQLVADDDQAELMSHMAQALMIGSPQILPPIAAADRRRIYQEFMRLYTETDQYESA